MKVREIASAVESFAPLGLQEKWDNSGLAIGSPDAEVHGVLVGFDCTPELIEEAIRVGADMVITHHPLIFGGLKKICPEDPVGKAVMMAVSNGISVYAAHTNADKVIEGVSGAMARRLGLKDIKVLDDDGAGHGLGAVGVLPSPLSFTEALELVRSAFGLSVVRCSRPLDCKIEKVAMCGGSGSSLIAAAQAAGAQLYLCGDVSYHHFFTSGDFMIMDIGHFESEVEIAEILFSLIRKNFPNFAVHMSSDIRNANPIYYF